MSLFAEGSSASLPARYIPLATVLDKAGPIPHPSGELREDEKQMTMFAGEKRLLGRTVLAAAALVGLLAFAATPRAFAREDPYYKCQRRIAKADYKLHEAIERHGRYSRQAEHQRHELREARERCWNDSPLPAAKTFPTPIWPANHLRRLRTRRLPT